MNNPSTLFIDKVICISKKINSVLPLPKLLDSIMETTSEILKAEGASVLLMDNEQKELIFISVVGDKKDVIKEYRVPVTEGIAGLVVRTKEPVIANDVETNPYFYRKIDEFAKFKTRNLIAFPLIVQDQVIGVLEVVNSIDRENFDNIDLKMLSYIAEISGIAIYNRILYDQLEFAHNQTNKRIRELDALYAILNQSTASIDKINIKKIFSITGDIISSTLDANRVSIFLKVDSENHLFEVVYKKGIDSLKEGEIIDINETKIMRIAKKFKQSVYKLNDVKYNYSLFYLREKENKESFNFITMPIVIIKDKETIIGFINVTNPNSKFGFDEYDLSLLSSISLTLGNIYRQYITNIEEIKQKITYQEITTAARLQRNMLSQSIPKFPKIKNIQAINIPARNVSGDFYGMKEIDNNNVSFYIGDVSGKGIPAAFFMAVTNTLLKEKIKFYNSPSKILSELNNTIFEELQEGLFITMAFFMVNTESKTIKYSFAGHNTQFFYKREGNNVIDLKTKGKPIGIMYNIDFEEQEIKYSEGDILVLFTDGVTEALIEKERRDEEELLREIIKSSASLDSKEIVNLIKETFLPKNEDLFDDFTLMVIKF